jgi:aryl-alcohol dehydrogenase-like predicted oxidoreductase
MQKRKLGRRGLEVPAMGLGCMGMTWAYGPSDPNEALRVLDRSLELGINFWDTAEVYGPFTNEELLGRALKSKRRDTVIIATKFAFRFNEKGEMAGLDSSPANIKRAIEGSLKRLGTDYIDLYYQHRLDPNTPIEDTVGALADLVKAGKIRHIGLSEVGPGTIRRAHAVHPVTAIQTEYSLWERGVEEKVLPVLRELGIGLVAYSPIGRGFLSGQIKKPGDLHESDFRRNHPRFQQENFDRNVRLLEVIKETSAANHATPAQIALAWVLHRGGDIVPIPGTKHLRYLEENAAAADLKLSGSAWVTLDKALSSFRTSGLRYAEPQMQWIDTSE